MSAPRGDVPRSPVAFAQDLRPSGLLHGTVVFADAAPRRVVELDLSHASQCPGVRAVMTAEDVAWQPRLRHAPLLVLGLARSVSDRLVLLAADTPEQARHAAQRVVVRTEPVPAVHDASAAHLAQAPSVWPGVANVSTVAHVRRGDPSAVARQAAYTLHRRYTLPWQDALGTHPQAVVAIPTPDGMEIQAGMEMPGLVRSLVADVLGLPHARVSTTALAMAGGLGQRDVWTAELAACAALLAHRTGRPVCLALDRADELRSSPKRPRCLVEHTLSATPEGRITSLQTSLLWDGGPYDSQALTALATALPGLLCPYDVKDAELTVQVARTHNARTAELLGGSLLPLVVALESQVDTLARDLGHHPTLVRRRNVPRAGARRSRAVLDVLTHAEPRVLAPISPWVKRGVGVALCRHRPPLWHAAARVDVHADGSITLKTSAAETGAEHPVALAHLAAHAMRVDPSAIHVRPLPEAAPFSSQDGRAVTQACSAVIRTLTREAAHLMNVNVSRVKHQARGFSAGRRLVTFAEAAAAAHARGVAPSGFGQGSVTAKPEDAWAGAVAEVDVDLATGLVKVTRVVETHEAGPPWHAAGLTREVEAGVRLGLGFSLSEDWAMEGGVFRSASLMQALMPGAVDGPPVDVVLQPAGPLHSVASVAAGVAAAAVRNAVANALGDAPLELPCTPERIMEVLVGRGLDPLMGVA